MDCKCIGYIKNFEKLNLNFQKKNILAFELIKCFLENEEFKKGFKLKRWYKPNKKGTKAKFEAIKDNEVEKTTQEIISKIDIAAKNLKGNKELYNDFKTEMKKIAQERIDKKNDCLLNNVSM